MAQQTTSNWELLSSFREKHDNNSQLDDDAADRTLGTLRVDASSPTEDPGHVRADGLHAPGDVQARNAGLRPAQPEARGANEVRQPGDQVPDALVDAGGVDSHEHVVLTDDRPVDLAQRRTSPGAPYSSWTIAFIMVNCFVSAGKDMVISFGGRDTQAAT